MSDYSISFSDGTKNPILINTGNTDYTTSLGLVGPNFKGYGPVLAKNFLQLLENFANVIQPASPTEGQLWYDTSNKDAKVLRIYDNASWYPINGIFQQGFEPDNTKVGDLWVDTTSMQIKVASSPGVWVSVGADFSQGLQTGAENKSILGTDGDYHSVIASYLNGEVLTILSKESFRPIAVIDGFDNLIPGLNFSTKLFDNSTPRSNGVATQSAALQVTVPALQTVSANFFLRKDIPQSLTESLVINNNTGIRIGATSSTVLLQKIGSDASISSISPGSKIRLSITDLSGVSQSLLTLDGGTRRIGIGPGNINPTATLDVSGTLRVSGETAVANNLTVGRELVVISTASFTDSINVLGSSTFIDTVYSTSIIPITAGTNEYTIGSPDRPFKSIYAQTIGSTSTQFNGNSGSSSKLSSAQQFALQGQVSSDTKLFNGTGAVYFNTQLTNSAIIDQISTSTVGASNSMLVSNGTSIFKVSKTNFLADVSPGLASSGMIMAWAGDTVPAGWALCDGANYNQSGIYNSLFAVIGIKYGSTAPGTFRVPNLPSLTATGPVTIKYIIRI